MFGDDVNIASRVEGFSPEGGISLSDKVYKDISSVKDIKTAFIGHRKLKGVAQIGAQYIGLEVLALMQTKIQLIEISLQLRLLLFYLFDTEQENDVVY